MRIKTSFVSEQIRRICSLRCLVRLAIFVGQLRAAAPLNFVADSSETARVRAARNSPTPVLYGNGQSTLKEPSIFR